MAFLPIIAAVTLTGCPGDSNEPQNDLTGTWLLKKTTEWQIVNGEKKNETTINATSVITYTFNADGTAVITKSGQSDNYTWTLSSNTLIILGAETGESCEVVLLDAKNLQLERVYNMQTELHELRFFTKN
ncbi:hypothetical protein FACS189429_5120 [Bacteroidia bacterium]|nr:hypothetical protein FACS189429_5120 [Bacteroidia bacterium]